MKKIFVIPMILITTNSSNNLANADCLKALDKDLKSTQTQLKKFSCKKEESFNFTCDKNAPKGWAKFYSKKFKNIENKVLKCLI